MDIFMFHFGRCGSTVLADSIKQIPGFVWHGEIFSRTTFVYKGFENSRWQEKKGNGQFTIDEFIDFIKDAKGGFFKPRHDRVHYGCEIKGYHFEYNFFKFSLEQALTALANEFSGCKFIFLQRSNSLRRILSSLIARDTNVYHTSSNLQINTIKLDFDNFCDYDLNNRGDILSVLAKSASREKYYMDTIVSNGGFIINYESDIQNDINDAMSLISTNLGVPLIKPKVVFVKTNPSPINHIVINYDELLKKLSGTEYAGFLD